MNISLIGHQNSGKTTIFNALAGTREEVASYSSRKSEPNIAVIEVLDDRVKRLSEIYKPQKTIYATIQLSDLGAAGKKDSEGGPFSGEKMALLRNMDALAAVIRNFEDEIIDEAQGKPDPPGDLDTIEAELMLADQIIVERRIERIEADLKRGKKAPQTVAEQKLLGLILEQLENSVPIREISLSPEQKKTISGYRFLSEKPLLVILNSGENNYGQESELLAKLSQKQSTIEFAGSFEMELAGLEPDEADEFMRDMGIEKSARGRLTTFAYEILGYISFFTVGEDEVRSWTLKRGSAAVDAAAAIHSDLARGFIRAECFTYENLISCGSEKALKEKGLIRLEGKEYTVTDGDILSIRFSV